MHVKSKENDLLLSDNLPAPELNIGHKTTKYNSKENHFCQLHSHQNSTNLGSEGTDDGTKMKHDAVQTNFSQGPGSVDGQPQINGSQFAGTSQMIESKNE